MRWKSLLLDDFRHLAATLGRQSADSRKVLVSSGLVPHVWPERPTLLNWLLHAACTVLVVSGSVFGFRRSLRPPRLGKGRAHAALSLAPGEALASDGEFTTAKLLEAPHANLTTANVPTLGKDVIVVTTTILGKTHRAAVVNGRLHREGDRIVIAGETFRLASVAEDRIELQTVGNHSASAHSLIIRRCPCMVSRNDHIVLRRHLCPRLWQPARRGDRPLARCFAHAPALGCGGSERLTIGIAKPCPDRPRSDRSRSGAFPSADSDDGPPHRLVERAKSDRCHGPSTDSRTDGR